MKEADGGFHSDACGAGADCEIRDGIVGKPRGFHDSLQQDGHSRDVQGRHRNINYNERKALGLGRVPFSFGIEKLPVLCQN